MKFRVVAPIVVTLVAGSLVAWPSVARWRENARHQAAFIDAPQVQRALRQPTAQRLRAVFSGGSRAILEHSPQLVLFSVEPTPGFEGEGTLFHGHKVLGQTVLTDSSQKAALLASLYDGLAPPQDNGLKQIAMGCFMPRHGIRAIQNGQVVDLLICFSCRQLDVYLNNRRISHAVISHTPGPDFNRVLAKHHVPISP